MEKLPVAPTPDTRVIYKILYVALVDGVWEENDLEIGTREPVKESEYKGIAEESLNRLYGKEGRKMENLTILVCKEMILF
jgi:hypothetical protein